MSQISGICGPVGAPPRTDGSPFQESGFAAHMSASCAVNAPSRKTDGFEKGGLFRKPPPIQIRNQGFGILIRPLRRRRLAGERFLDSENGGRICAMPPGRTPRYRGFRITSRVCAVITASPLYIYLWCGEWRAPAQKTAASHSSKYGVSGL